MTKKPAAEKAVSAVKKPRAVRPSATRVTSARHSKSAVSSEATPAVQPVVSSIVSSPTENAHEAISQIAYGYWEGRGYQGGNSTEDWFRAEFEYRGRQAAL